MSQKEKDAQKLILNLIEKVNNLMIKHFEKFCEDTNGTSIPMIYIRESYKILIDGYKAGIVK